MKLLVILGTFFFIFAASLADTSKEYQSNIRPVAESCRNSLKVTDNDIETVVLLDREFSPEAKCLSECIMTKIKMMKDGTLRSVEEILIPYKVLFADDPKRLENAEEKIRKCREEAIEKFPNDSCGMAHYSVICVVVNSG